MRETPPTPMDFTERAPVRLRWKLANETYWKQWSFGVSFSATDVHLAFGPWIFGFVKVEDL